MTVSGFKLSELGESRACQDIVAIGRQQEAAALVLRQAVQAPASCPPPCPTSSLSDRAGDRPPCLPSATPTVLS